MNSILGFGILLAYSSAAVAIIACRPNWVSDQNTFMKNFVNHEFLALLGVVLTITLASIANIHLEFNKIEERLKRRGLSKSRSNLHGNAAALLFSFVAAVVLVIVKPIAVDASYTGQGIFNMAAIFIVLLDVLVLTSVTQLIFEIGPDIPE